MVYDDIVIGSGLAALATVMGLSEDRKILVLAAKRTPDVHYYDSESGIPCANFGFGGLGTFWHGVIPTGHTDAFTNLGEGDFVELFNIFYPKTKLLEKLHYPWLFVPYKPIRPAAWWKQLVNERRGRLEIVHQLADSIEIEANDKVSVYSDRSQLRCHRVWIACGALGTPKLLANSPGLTGASRNSLSDHVIAYIGQIDRGQHPHILPPIVERKSSGVWMQGKIDEYRKGLVTIKPARFGYRQLDYGVEQRSAFGLPVKGLLYKVYRAGSLGLIAESLFNKFGIFPDASILSVYAQIHVNDAYSVDPVGQKLVPNIDAIQASILGYRKFLNIPEINFSRSTSLFIRGIHLHHSLDQGKLTSIGINTSTSNVAIVDSSVIENIGPEHHSFKIMVAAYSRAKNS